jgi:hypothetical protein
MFGVFVRTRKRKPPVPLEMKAQFVYNRHIEQGATGFALRRKKQEELQNGF